jgi:hypothetical protein
MGTTTKPFLRTRSVESLGCAALADPPLNSLYEGGDSPRNFVDSDTGIVLQQAPGQRLRNVFEQDGSPIGRSFEQLLRSKIDVFRDFLWMLFQCGSQHLL